MSDSSDNVDEKTPAVPLLVPVRIPRDSSNEAIITEVYRLQSEVNGLRMELANVKSQRDHAVELSSTLEDHSVTLHEHDGKIQGLERSVKQVKQIAEHIDKSIKGMRENSAILRKSQERRDVKIKEDQVKILEKLELLVELHQQKITA